MKIDHLSAHLFSRKDLADFSNKIDEFSLSLFDLKTAPDTKLDRIFTGEFNGDMRGFLEENDIKLDSDPIALQKTLSETKKELQKLPLVKLELAIEPTRELMAAIAGWFSVSLPQKYILDVQVNKVLIGALSITVNGKYKDYSVKKRLADFSLAHNK